MSNPTSGTCCADDPRTRVAAVFTRIAASRMRDVPLCNPALRVETVGLRRWLDEWLGVLITPWAISLMLLPGGGGVFRPLATGESQVWHFPSGRYEFIGHRESELGAYQLCSLFSPVFEFESPDLARATACCALDALLRPPERKEHAEREAATREAGRLAGIPLARQRLSRRSFLRTLTDGPR